MNELLFLDARLRAALVSHPRVTHALAYGSVPQGLADAHSDLEYFAYLDPVDVSAFLAEITPIHLFVLNDFGVPNAVTDGLRRIELHVEPHSRLADVTTWPPYRVRPEAMLVKDADGHLAHILRALATRETPVVNVPLEFARLLNWLVFGASVLARGERVRTLEVLWWVRGALLRLARLAEDAPHRPNAARLAERDLCPETLERFAALTGHVGDIAELYHAAWTWTKDLARAFSRAPLPAPLAADLDARFSAWTS